MGERGPKKGSAFGAAAITKAVKGADFPMTKKELIDQYGNTEVEFTKGNPQKLKEVLKNLPGESFNSPADIEHEIHKNR